jgi:hypothetical protein
MTTAGAAKPREPHRDRAKQRRHPMKPPVLEVTRLTARKAIRTQNRVIVGVDGDDRLLQTRQDLLRLSQRQPQLRDLAGATEWPDILHIDAPAGPSIPVSTKRKTHPIREPPASNRSGGHIACVPIPHILDTPMGLAVHQMTSVGQTRLPVLHQQRFKKTHRD